MSTITFHGGDNSITYPWGNFPHKGTRSPDEYSFESVAARLRNVAGTKYPGKGRSIQPYKIGTMNAVVYPCRGPYEDFVYAASFDKSNSLICKPQYSQREKLSGKSTGYPANRQKYSDKELRAFVYLVESSNDKEPSESYFGKYGAWENQGHVSRNLLISTILADITGPTATVTSMNHTTLASGVNLNINF